MTAIPGFETFFEEECKTVEKAVRDSIEGCLRKRRTVGALIVGCNGEEWHERIDAGLREVYDRRYFGKKLWLKLNRNRKKSEIWNSNILPDP